MIAPYPFHQLKTAVPRLYQTVAAGLEETEAYIRDTLKAENPLLTAAATHLSAGGGKRLRPALLLLCNAAIGDNQSDPVPAAAAVEIIHMASLVHDDIIDDAPLRRGRATLHKQWNRKTALYTGNFMVCKGLELAAAYDHPAVNTVALRTATAMCKGEFVQQAAAYTGQCREEDYFLRIGNKTAELIAAACEIGAYLGGAEEATATVFRRYGYDLGMAFQITDDILDYTSPEGFGKKRGTDLKEGNITLPLIYALKNGLAVEKLQQYFDGSGENQRERAEIIAAVIGSGSTEQAEKIAAEYIRRAKAEIQTLPRLAYKECFLETADYILERKL